MVLLTMTPALVAAVKEYKALRMIPESTRSSFKGDLMESDPSLGTPIVGDPISHGQVLEISCFLLKCSKLHKGRDRKEDQFKVSSSYHLDELLRGSQVYIHPPKPKAETTSEYKELMTRLRQEEEQRAYERMLDPHQVSATSQRRFATSPHAHIDSAVRQTPIEEDEITYADINRQVALIINVLVSIIACSAAIWIAARHWSTPSRLAFSMSGSILVAVAEVSVYAGYLGRLQDARQKARKQIEIKEIVRTWVIGGNEESAELTQTSSPAKEAGKDKKPRQRKRFTRR